ncbi:MAG: DUF2313 domain-containing protein [Peptococcaceae bacterium]|nr:DUF2313 domain-containing protein [Peptococcaceae bacterium]
MNKEILIKAIHRLYRKDKWLNDLFNAVGVEIDKLDEYISDLEAQYFLDTATWSLDARERDAGLTVNRGKSYKDRRAAIVAKERAGGKVDMIMLQSIADSWQNGTIRLEFTDGRIYAQLAGENGIPDDLESLQKALDETKPAHLAVVYAFRYLLIKDVHGKMTLAQMEALPLNRFAGREV